MLATGISAMVLGEQIYHNLEKNGLRYTKSGMSSQIVGMGQGWWDAMISRGVPEWITYIGKLKGCILDLPHDEQEKITKHAVGLLKDDGLDIAEATVIARGLYFYLNFDYDSDDIMKMIHESESLIQDSWNEDPRLADLELM